MVVLNNRNEVLYMKNFKKKMIFHNTPNITLNKLYPEQEQKKNYFHARISTWGLDMITAENNHGRLGFGGGGTPHDSASIKILFEETTTIAPSFESSFSPLFFNVGLVAVSAAFLRRFSMAVRSIFNGA